MIIGYLPVTLVIQNISLGLARIIVPIFVSVLIGFAQWLVLRQVVNGSHDWIFNHMGGWVVGYSLGLLVVQLLSKIPYGALVGFLLFGFIISLFQWPVLRREIPHIWSWILANVAGWTLGALASQLIVGSIDQTTRTTLLTSTLASVGITGLVAGAVTAIALIWIVRKPEMTLYP